MKTDTIYAHPMFGSLIFVIDNKDGIITFSAATYLNDLFTTIIHYIGSEDEIKEHQFVELTKDNYELYTCYKALGSELVIKADGAGQSYKYSTEWNLPHAEKTIINNKRELFKDWKYVNIL